MGLLEYKHTYSHKPTSKCEHNNMLANMVMVCENTNEIFYIMQTRQEIIKSVSQLIMTKIICNYYYMQQEAQLS